MKQICQNGINSMGFNRYMVECECKSAHIAFLYRLVLIDTWWNVNFTSIAYAILSTPSFNRYMVECELSFI